MNCREITEANEKLMLSPRAMLSVNSAGRLVPEEPDEYRTCYQRDRDRVIHSKSFRRLKHKTQVFLSPEGDHYRTRLTHTLEVAQIARTISRALALNEDLTEAIAMAHDLGHTPFGHAGERVLDRIYPGGFRHYEQSVRVVDKLEKDGRGLNLTLEVRNGIVCHTKGTWAKTLEGRVVRVADRIAYINHDIDDAIRAGIITNEDLPAATREYAGNSTSQRINSFVTSVIKNSGGNIGMDDTMQAVFDELHEYMFSNVYTNPECKGEEIKAVKLIEELYDYFCNHPDELPEELKIIAEEEGKERAVCDYIAGMTDGYAIETFSRIFIPMGWDKL